ncbi:hypothetical protein AB0B27_05680 [Micromonospora rifamycinica]|uniref:hypothetical protein n=1 Tax=Micromonospora rifamycinica TaxID=291594 RepID=UPI0033E7207F
MSLLQRIHARRTPRPTTRYVNRFVVGTPAELATLLTLATEHGILVFASAPVPLPEDPTRFRRHLRLRAR